MRLRRGPRITRISRLARGRRLDRNPLRRGTDRAETVILAGLLAVFLGGMPFAAQAVATWSNTTSLRQLQAQQATVRQVRATLLQAPVSLGGYAAVLPPQADARWTAPDGHAHTGIITAPAQAKAGSTVLIWTGPSGNPVTPLQPGQIPEQGELAAAVAVAVLAVPLLLAAWTARRALNRRRLAAWEADWLATGPRWTT